MEAICANLRGSFVIPWFCLLGRSGKTICHVTYTSSSTLPSRSAMLLGISDQSYIVPALLCLAGGHVWVRLRYSLVSDALLVVGEHVGASGVEHLIQLGNSLFVLRARDRGLHRRACRFIGEVWLLRGGCCAEGSGRKGPGADTVGASACTSNAGTKH